MSNTTSVNENTSIHRQFRQTWSILSAAFLLVFVGCTTTHPSYNAAQLPPELIAPAPVAHRGIQLQSIASSNADSSLIVPGDLLNVHVSSGAKDESEKPLISRVSESGDVDLPYIGAVRLVGLDATAAGQTIANAAIERGIYQHPNVAIDIKERATNSVMVLGEVEKPGLHELPRGTCDVLSAIAAAGGMTEEAGMDVDVMRQSRTFLASNPQPTDESGVVQVAYQPQASGPITERINLAQAHASQLKPKPLGDGDVVMVTPKEKRVIHVTGLVKTPDQFELPDDQPVRVLDALAMAGGRTTPVADRVLVIRNVKNIDQPAVIAISVAKAKREGSENLVLGPGDLVTVEATVATTVVDTLKNFMRVTLGVSSSLTAF